MKLLGNPAEIVFMSLAVAHGCLLPLSITSSRPSTAG